MTASPQPSYRDDPELLRSRIGQVGKIMFVVFGLGASTQVVLNPAEQLLHPGFLLMCAVTAVMGLMWLLCRKFAMSPATTRSLELVSFVVTAFVIAAMGRFLAAQMLDEYGTKLTETDSGLHAMAVFSDKYMVVSVLAGMSYPVLLRAALVPTRPLYTLGLTVAMGIPLGVAWLFPGTWFGAPVDTPMILSPATDVVVWWTLTSIVSFAVARIFYGLRREVAEAKRLGQYTLGRRIGGGGMGEVYEATHAMMQRPSAIKLLTNTHREDHLRRFEREVQLTTRLTHPNTIIIYDYGRTDEGVFYYVMELLEGASLHEVVETTGPQPEARVAAVLLQVLAALEEAHSVGLIHRDVKPANILLCKRGGAFDVAKLLDFGLVKDVASESDVEITSEAVVAGTPLYMSPEAIRSPDEVDARSDLYSLAAVGYYMLTGRHVFAGKSVVEVCSHHLHTDPEPPSNYVEISEALETLLLRGLEKDPDARPSSAREFAESLQASGFEIEWDREQAAKWWKEHQPTIERAREANETEAEPSLSRSFEQKRSQQTR
ncbi:MAG: serine/threonine-protein kinase [Myxococcota bacterium]